MFSAELTFSVGLDKLVMGASRNIPYRKEGMELLQSEYLKVYTIRDHWVTYFQHAFTDFK